MRPPVFVFLCALVGCAASGPERRADWCGTERASLRYLGDLTERCKTGDVYACAVARGECTKRSGAWCAESLPAATDPLLDECLAREALDGERCLSPNVASTLAGRPELSGLYRKGCDGADWNDCFELGLVREHAGEDPDAEYARACDRDVGAACARLGDRKRARREDADALFFRACTRGASHGCDVLDERVRAAADLERAGRYDDAVRVDRLACFKWSRQQGCAELESFRARASGLASLCESGDRSACKRASGMVRAASQGPRDDARADALMRAE